MIGSVAPDARWQVTSSCKLLTAWLDARIAEWSLPLSLEEKNLHQYNLIENR